MYFIEEAKGVAMDTMTLTQPTAQPMMSRQSTAVSTDISSSQNISTNTTKNVNENRLNADISERENGLKPEEIKEEFNKLSDDLNLDVSFAYNAKLNVQYINVTDKSTGQVIRKLPTEEAMKIKESMADLVGMLLDKKG